MRKGRGKLYKTPKDRPKEPKPPASVGLAGLEKAVVAKHITPKDKKPQNNGKSSVLINMNSVMNSGLVDGLIANSLTNQNSKKRRERGQTGVDDAYSNLVSSHNSQEVISIHGLKPAQETMERNPSRIELSTKEQKKLMKLLDGAAAMPYNDIFQAVQTSDDSMTA